MAQSRDQANAALIAHYIEEMGRNVSEAIKFSMQRKLQEKQFDLQAMTKIKDFMSLPPDKRKALLLDPDFRSNMMQTLDPEAFRTKKKVKNMSPDTLRQKEMSAMALGESTPEEKVKQEKLSFESKKAEQEGIKAQADADIAKRKKEFATGERTATPMDLLTNFDVKDPLAAALFTMVPKEDLTNIALAEKKQGPIYQQQQQQDWYKWGTDQGFSPGLAMQTALAVSKGEWDKVPQMWEDPTTKKMMPVRGLAEQKLAVDMMQARTQQQAVQNTIQSSIATASVQFSEKSALPLDKSRANIVALRSGKPIPYPTPYLEEMANLNLLAQRQEVELNTQKILDDKAGLGMIKETLNTLFASYKNADWTGAETKDLKDKIEQTQQELVSRLAGRYGIEYKKYEELHPGFFKTVGNAMGVVWEKAIAPTGAYGVDFTKAVGETLKSFAPDTPTVSPRAVTQPKVGTKKHTPEQEAILRNLYSSFQSALTNNEVPAGQKLAIQKYITDVLEPAYSNPDNFMNLFTQYEVQ